MAPRKNPIEPTVDLELGGETYRLFFSFEAVADAEDLTGEALVLGLSRKSIVSPRVSFVRAMLYACLQPHNPKVTLSEARAMVTHANLQAVWGKILAAWTAGMKEVEEDVPGDPQQRQS